MFKRAALGMTALGVTAIGVTAFAQAGRSETPGAAPAEVVQPSPATHSGMPRFAQAAPAAVTSGTVASAGTANACGPIMGTAVGDPKRIADGYRLTRVVGSSVENEADENVGTIDDIILDPNQKALYAVLSVGGFLGIGTHYVAVPFDRLQLTDHGKRLVRITGATKDSLKQMPEFTYPS